MGDDVNCAWCVGFVSRSESWQLVFEQTHVDRGLLNRVFVSLICYLGVFLLSLLCTPKISQVSSLFRPVTPLFPDISGDSLQLNERILAYRIS